MRPNMLHNLDTLAELLEVWPVASVLCGDARGAIRQIDKQTDRLSQAANKKALAYLSGEVTSGRCFLNLVPRGNNIADNMTQQGPPYTRWLRRTETLQGTNPEIYVSDTIRTVQRFHREEQAKLAARRRYEK